MASSPEGKRNIVCAQVWKSTHWFSKVLQNMKCGRTEDVFLSSTMWISVPDNFCHLLAGEIAQETENMDKTQLETSKRRTYHLRCDSHWVIWGSSTGNGGNGNVLLEGSDRGEMARENLAASAWEKGVKKQIMGFYNTDKIRLVVAWTLKQHWLKPATMAEMSVTKREISKEVFKMWAYRT